MSFSVQFGTSILKDKIELLIACVDEIMNDPVEHNEAQMWKEMVATASTAVMYEICRVQKLTPIELRSSFAPALVYRAFEIAKIDMFNHRSFRRTLHLSSILTRRKN